jgi:hypothetical protein
MVASIRQVRGYPARNVNCERIAHVMRRSLRVARVDYLSVDVDTEVCPILGSAWVATVLSASGTAHRCYLGSTRDTALLAAEMLPLSWGVK